MIWIVTASNIAENVLKAIHEKISDKNPGQVFVFSVPVNNAIGFKLDPDKVETGE